MIQNLILLTGEDTYRLSERLRFYKKAFVQKYPGSEIETYTEKSDFSLLENAALTPNLFGSRRLIICENFWTTEHFEKAEKSGFFTQLPNASETCTIICSQPNLDKRKKVSKFLLKNAKVEAFAPMSENQTWDWVAQYTVSHGGTITHANVKKLVHRCGENGWNLSQEIAKLISASSDGVITEDLIETLTLPHPKVIIWSFLENLSKKNRMGALGSFRKLCVMGESVHQILAMIIREVRIHAQILSGIRQRLSAKEIATEAGFHPFVIQKTMGLSRNFSMSQIEGLYDELFQVDQRIKTGGIMLSTDDQGELELAIEKLILRATA